VCSESSDWVGHLLTHGGDGRSRLSAANASTNPQVRRPCHSEIVGNPLHTKYIALPFDCRLSFCIICMDASKEVGNESLTRGSFTRAGMCARLPDMSVRICGQGTLFGRFLKVADRVRIALRSLFHHCADDFRLTGSSPLVRTLQSFPAILAVETAFPTRRRCGFLSIDWMPPSLH